MAVPGKKGSKQFSSSTTSMASDEDLQVYCQPCDEEGTRLPAHGFCTDCKEHLCKTCFAVHKKLKSTKHHTVLDASIMPKALQQPSTSIHTSQSDDLTTPCCKHPQEIIKFYCNDHKKLLCSVCVTLEHQGTICKVDYIPDISGNIIDSKEYQVILKALNSTFDHYQQTVKDVKEMTAKSNRSLKDALEDIKKFRKEINQRLDKLERHIVHLVKVTEQENNSNITSVETACEEITKPWKISSEKINQLNTSKQANALFMELKLAEKMMEDVEKTAPQLSTYDVKEHHFEANETILTKLKTERSLGTLTQKTLNKECQPVQIKSRQSSHEGEICVRTSKDQYSCYITGMILLTPDLLIITDYHNNAVKMVDTSSQSVSDQLQLDDKPWDITTVASTELAVTLPDIQTIQFISISSNTLKMRHTVKVGGKCYGISCYQGKLVVSFYNPAKLQILDMNGTILTTIDGKNIFKDPEYITCNRSSIYVSDWKMKTVTRLNWQGDVIGSYSGMSKSRGMSLSDDGTVFVCDNERNVIEEISEDCSTGKVVLENLNDPYTVCWCGETKKLYYSCNTVMKKMPTFYTFINCHKTYTKVLYER
ncbi:E3 ubiquitin-protein ligase TRIM33-like [Ruditapes philippinarum]|uniref:E3 ubiquitin-protein ligase TRIM33-like n=1 Tax=Ruditapes philippinarum TaxID=129788 RepID=UPI00295B63D7|nr:E3 ubiquitin-protein ligase TRIM33-like [Ruditapes philippinarum]